MTISELEAQSAWTGPELDRLNQEHDLRMNRVLRDSCYVPAVMLEPGLTDRERDERVWAGVKNMVNQTNSGCTNGS